jgi:hypothetical protein
MADDHESAEEEVVQAFTRLQGDLESGPAKG